MPRVFNVHMSVGIQLHSGNTEADTKGCVIIALHRNVERVAESPLACIALFTIFTALQKQR